MENTTILEFISAGFFFGIGWWTAKALFVIAISKWLGKPLEVSTEEV